ncbi:WXG100 family type VII secretion target [Nocardia sp. NPDC058666]|uniref:WXG100 family type VII secretion target n=1 Tax=Nocardia sp. NPDC058666 TaxID=3346587 RepID=UPI00365946D7
MVFEDKQIPKQEHTPDFRHPQINGAFKPLEPTGNALAAAGQYSQIAQKWREGVTDFAARMNRASAAAWDGQAAERSREAIKNYTQRATELTPELEALATRVGQTAQAITTTKDALPDPGQSFEFTSPSTWDIWNNKDPDEQEEVARRVMAQHYVKPFTEADAGIPVLPTPVSPTNPLHGAIDDGTGGGGTGGGGTGGGSMKPGDGSGGTSEPATTEDPAAQQEVEDPAAAADDDSTDDGSSTSDENGGGDETAPSSATPEGATAPAAASPAGGTPSTGSPGGGAGGGGGGTPGSPVAAPVPGRAVAGAPTAGTPTGIAGAGSGSSSAGRSGMPGMMGAPGAGRGKGGEDDDTHQIPDYLITAENTEELLGEMPNTIAGGVIGGDAPSANTPPPAPPRPQN